MVLVHEPMYDSDDWMELLALVLVLVLVLGLTSQEYLELHPR